MKFVDVLKWIGVLPIAIISWIIVYGIINLMYRILSPVEFTQWAITIMASGGSGCAFVFAGSWIAPKGKKVVSIVLATVMGIFALTSLVLSFCGYGDNSIIISVISAVATIVGCVIACVQVHEE
jgi:hypothetical protein